MTERRVTYWVVALSGLAFVPAASWGQGVEQFTVSRDDRLHEGFPDLALAANGDLVVVYQESDSHGGGPVSTIVARTSPDRGRTWSGRIVLAEIRNRMKEGWLNCPRLIRRKDNTLFCAVDWIPQDPPKNAYFRWCDNNARVWFYESIDHGKTWSGAKKSPIGGIVPGLIELRSGTLLVNVTRFEERQVEVNNDFREFLVLYRSTDNGKTWAGPAPLPDDPWRQPNEGDFVELPGGEVVCYMRADRGRTGLKTVSRDGGLTWSPLYGSGPWIYLGRPAAGLLRSGCVLLSTRVQNPPRTPGNYLGIYMEPCQAALEPNPLDAEPPRGARWALLDNDTHKKRPDWGYSGWVELPDGSVYVVQYIADGAPTDKTFIRGYLLSKGFLDKMGRGEGSSRE